MPAHKDRQPTTLRARLGRALFGARSTPGHSEDLAAATPVSVRIADDPGWTPLHTPGPHDRDFSEWLQDQSDALEAWRKNFLVRRIVTLTRSYVLGGGISLSSGHRAVQTFLSGFTTHPKNDLAARLGPICDELTRAGEIFPILFTNRADGMSTLRFLPASQIHAIETDPEDYETELAYHASNLPGSWEFPGRFQGKRWLAASNPDAWIPTGDGSLPPVMLHYAVNRPIGATRGEGDLGPILRWALRYSNWLEDRVRLNRVRTRQQLLEIKLADDTKVLERKRQVETEDPVRAGIYVHGPGEEVVAHKLEIGAGDAAEDGRALRLAIATGANTALHYMGEGESTNYATAREMGEPTARFYAERQAQLCAMLCDLVQVAYRRKAALGLARPPAGDDYQLCAAVTETARADNALLAEAAYSITQALATMRAHGWIDDESAVTLAFKFAGEPLGREEVADILRRAPRGAAPDDISPDAPKGGAQEATDD